LAIGAVSGRAADSSGLLERDAELAEIERLVAQACAGAGVLLAVEGPAGAGKTRLLGAAALTGQAREMLVLEASGSELERELGFGVVRSLFEGVLADAGAARRRSLLSGAAALARPVVWPSGADVLAAVSAEPASVVHGLFWLVSNLAERDPLMLVVDDTHWADLPSLRFLTYLARRRGGLALMLVVAMRPREPDGQGELVSALSADPAGEVLSPAPLSEGAVRLLIGERFGSAAREFVAACHAATGGNPFLVGELLAALASDRVAATADNAARVGQIGPETVSRAVLTRVSRIGGGAGALTEAVAVLGSGELRHGAALAGLGQDVAACASDALSQIGVLRQARPLQFVHPLVHAAVYEAIPPGRRSVMHRAAARLLADEGASPDRIGLHLLNAEPAGEQWVVEALREAATAASVSGAPEQAAGYLRRALREPADDDERAGLLHQLGAAELLARDQAATDHLSAALDAAEDPRARGEIALLLGRAAVSTGRLADARELLGPVIAQLADTQPEVATRLEAYRSTAGAWHPRFTAELERELPRLRAVAERGGAAGRSLLLLVAFRSAFEGGRREEIVALLERGLDRGRLLESESAEAIEITWAVRALTFIDELDRADRLVGEMVADSRTRGSVMGYAAASAWRAAIASRRGLVGVAEADARSAVELATEHGLYFIAPLAYSFLGEALIEQGELESAAVTFEHAELGPMRGTRPELRFLHTRARVRLARGDRQAAIADLRPLQPTEQSPGYASRNPNVLAWRSTLALALPASARAEAMTLADQELHLARNIGQPRGIGVALRTRGLLSKGAEQISLLTQAVAALEDCPSPLERAHALTDLGAALRRASRRSEARPLLARGLDLAAGCGATALAARAREELVTAGARPRRERLNGVEALTAGERRVAQMAAAGMTNREIAQALFVTIKTVALHLTHTYEKLDIAGRAQLPAALGTLDTPPIEQ
jgi:DNA-binding CsgD family transcriptional regulator/tetratricopeptide (TPR) repeat protein